MNWFVALRRSKVRLERRIAVLEAKNDLHQLPKEIWWLHPTTEVDLERGWQRAIRNFYDPERKAWGSEEVQVDARVYSATNKIERFIQG
jgi:hypothetical protein